MVTWFHPHGGTGTVLNSLAGGTKKVYIDEVLDDVADTNYPAGTIVGGTLELYLNAGVDLIFAPHISTYVLPPGASLTLTDSEIQDETDLQYFWLRGDMTRDPSHPTGWVFFHKLNTKRDYVSGAHYIVHIANRDSIAFSAGAAGTWQIDFYLHM